MWVFFFFNDTATTEIYTLSLHDALPISSAPGRAVERSEALVLTVGANAVVVEGQLGGDRKSTRLNSSHSQISYAVFCLKKKNTAVPGNLPPLLLLPPATHQRFPNPVSLH